MAAIEIKRVKENLSCPVCYQIFKNPRYLPCHHSYCEECLQKLLKNLQITCPECRNVVDVPNGDVKELPDNFFINRLVDEFILKNKIDSGSTLHCDKCEEDDPAVTYCPECRLLLCNVCNDAHQRDKVTRWHGVILQDDLKSVPVQPKPKIPMCKEHGIQLNVYCATCEKLICMYCTVKHHAGHDHNTVNLMVNKYKPELQKNVTFIDEMTTKLISAHDKVQKVRCTLGKQREAIYSEIDQCYDEIVGQLLKQKDETKKGLNDIKAKEDKSLVTLQEEIELAKTRAVNVKNFNVALMKSSDSELLSAKQQATIQVNELTEKCHELVEMPQQLLEISTAKFLPTQTPIPQFGQIFLYPNPDATEVLDLPKYVYKNNNVTIKIITKCSNDYKCPHGDNEVSVMLESIMGKCMAAEVEDNKDGSYTASFLAQQIGFMKLSVWINREAMKKTHTFKVYNNYKTMEKPSKVISLDGSMGEAWGIAFNSDNKWAVTDRSKHHVYIFDAENNDQRTAIIGGKGSNNGQFKNPRGVTFDSNNRLYVADCDNYRIQKFDIDGNYLLQFGSRGSNVGQLNDLCGITAHNERVYVAERGNKRVSVFTTNGQFSHHIGKEQLGRPCSVQINESNQLLVADNSHHCIYTFMLDGQCLNKFETSGSGRSHLHPCTPVSMTTDLYGFVLVGCNESHRVIIYDRLGNFVHCFGSKGTGNGQFSFPRQIAISLSGNVYVCDRSNCRVQIFSST